MKTFVNITEIKQANKNLGEHFFDRASMRFFNSRVESKVLRGRYFVTSEIGPDEHKLYSVRMADESGSIETIGEFNVFETIREAKAFIKNLPFYFPCAFNSAKDEFNGHKQPGMSFVDNALIEPTNRKDKGFDTDTFAGACSWICENAHILDNCWLEGYATEYKQKLNS